MVVPQLKNNFAEGAQDVLILAPTGQDAALLTKVLTKAGTRCETFRSVSQVVARLQRDAGILLFAEEALIPSTLRELRNILAEQEPWSDIPIIVMTSGGETTFASLRVLKEFEPSGNVTLLERPFRPITLTSSVQVALRARRRQFQVRDLIEAHKEATRVRDEFISIASHELKTPLTSLKLHTQINLRYIHDPGNESGPGLPERFHKFVRVSAQQVDRLARLVEDMLDVSRISSGKLVLAKSAVDLPELLREVADRLAPQIAAAGCTLSLSAGVPVRGTWDRYRIEQVIINLITNAIRYGKGKPISVSLTEEEGAAVLKVKDEGVGIAPEDQERIFERFERAQTGRNIDGLGLGLYICHQIVQSHGGSIGVTSAPEQGAEFTVRLPAEQAALRAEA
jgi:signal transduction histidine kinase